MKCNFCPLDINNIGSLRNHEKYCLSNPNKSIRPVHPSKGTKGLFKQPLYPPIPCVFCSKSYKKPTL